MLLRHAVLADLPGLLDVQEAGSVLGLGHLFPQDSHPFPRAGIGARWTREIADPGVEVYVVERAPGRIEGFAALRGDELLHFGTAVETWGSGLAGLAHDELLARLAAAGHPRARLRVFAENHRARRFYEKRDWRATGGETLTSYPPHPTLLDYERAL